MVRNFELTNDYPCQEPVTSLRGVQKKYIFASMASEVKLAFWESSSFASSVWFFTTSLQNHSQFLLPLCIFGITVNYGDSKKTMSLKFLCFFVNFFFLSCLLHRMWMLIFQLRMQSMLKERKLFSEQCRHSIIESKVEEILRYCSIVEGSCVGRKAV